MEKNGASPNAVSPPSGTGFTAGMGESFSLDLNSGQGTFSIPFDLPEGVAGHTPRVTLEYVHGQGNGPFGYGWRLKMREITRRLDLGTPDQGARKRRRDVHGRRLRVYYLPLGGLPGLVLLQDVVGLLHLDAGPLRVLRVVHYPDLLGRPLQVQAQRLRDHGFASAGRSY